MSAATPGPWRLGRVWDPGEGCRYTDLNAPSGEHLGNIFLDVDDQPLAGAANAALIAAAPALRDALAFALMEEGACNAPECDCWRKRAQEALKAAGR